MSEIKLPVTVEGHAFCTDAEDKILSVREVVAALNAAPKRAFAELTAKDFALLLMDAKAAAAREHLAVSEVPIETAKFFIRVAEFMLPHLQAFAAPVAPANAQGWIVANGDQTRFRCWGDSGPEWTEDRIAALHFSRKQDAEAFCRDDEDAGYILPVAAPGTQGGREDV
jgi:hypothetical protein